MGKYYKGNTPQVAPKEGEKKVDVLQTYSFPEHGLSIQAVDMQDAILKLNAMLEGGK